MKALQISSNNLPYLLLQMITSLQKRRNPSNESPYENKFYLKRQHAHSALLNYPSFNAFKQRIPNKGLVNSETQDNLHKKSILSPQRYNHQLSVIQDKFSTFSSKIKTLLKPQIETSKQNNGLYQTNVLLGLSRSALMKRTEQQQARQMEQQKQRNNTVPYFIECLKRKNMIKTEACMHIHTSILTFKQYFRAAQSVKAKQPDLKYALEQQNRKTVVFDMDETLIHTNQAMVKGYEIKVPFKSVQGKITNGYVHVRPYAKEIIKNISKHFDVIVFTAGNQCYADPILDYLDPDKCIKHRLYRESCTMVNCQLFVKDLRILGRSLQSVVLVDNAPYSYLLQPANGIPILNYMKGKDDDQLIRLQDYLMSLLNVDDVRVVNNETFRLKQYVHYQNYEKLIYALYGKWM